MKFCCWLLSMPLSSKISKYVADEADSVVSFVFKFTVIYRVDVSMEVWNDCYIPEPWVVGHGEWFIFFHVEVFEYNCASYEYKNRSANNGAQLVPIGIPKYCWKTWFPKSYINVGYQKLNHLFIIHFRVLVCTIRMLFNKIDLQIPDDKVSKFTWSICIEKVAINDVKKL